MATRSTAALAQPVLEADPVRRALEEAKSRPLPPPEEQARLMGLAREAIEGPFLPTEDFLARLPPLQRAAIARGFACGASPGPDRDRFLEVAAEAERDLPSAAE
jgi:hypothetical protein